MESTAPFPAGITSFPALKAELTQSRAAVRLRCYLPAGGGGDGQAIGQQPSGLVLLYQLHGHHWDHHLEDKETQGWGELQEVPSQCRHAAHIRITPQAERRRGDSDSLGFITAHVIPLRYSRLGGSFYSNKTAGTQGKHPSPSESLQNPSPAQGELKIKQDVIHGRMTSLNPILPSGICLKRLM